MTDYHHFHPSILRAYDIRGVYGDTLRDSDAYAIGRAFGSQIAELGGKSIAVGWDGRASSPALSMALSQGLAECGLTVTQIGCGPTPMLYFAVHHLKADGGIMVTGSHNPPDYNGFKLMAGKAAIFGEEIQSIGRRAARADYVTAHGHIEQISVETAYVDRLTRDVRLDDKMACGWDPGNGAVAQILEPLLERIPGRNLPINDIVDSTFPNHHPDPSDPKNLEQVQRLVREKELDIGFAFDGDGDRLGVIDRNGRIVWPDQLLVLLARQVLGKLPGRTIIADVKASQTLFDEVAKAGGKPLMWKTGHSLVKAKMVETKAPLAGEMSGHIFYADRWYGFDDAIYAALRSLEALAEDGRPLHEIVDALPVTVATPEIRIDCGDDVKFEIVDAVGRSLHGSPGKVIDIDGVRVVGEDGWWLLRASNTQPALVARCEGVDAAALERLQAQLDRALSEAGLGSPAEPVRATA
ncbi:MAG: phosphomannomutase/phosphoglucomutase [Pseudomonadota bacterium]|nr:phosphomannomutase/phosphoglucomutase [Pseudomonadota bacterium]